MKSCVSFFLSGIWYVKSPRYLFHLIKLSINSLSGIYIKVPTYYMVIKRFSSGEKMSINNFLSCFFLFYHINLPEVNLCDSPERSDLLTLPKWAVTSHISSVSHPTQCIFPTLLLFFFLIFPHVVKGPKNN